jgi:hypothetical protein
MTIPDLMLQTATVVVATARIVNTQIMRGSIPT